MAWGYELVAAPFPVPISRSQVIAALERADLELSTYGDLDAVCRFLEELRLALERTEQIERDVLQEP